MMKLDMDLVRQILFQVEDCMNPWGLEKVAMEGYPPQVVDYHVVYCVDSGLLEGGKIFTGTSRTYESLNLTPAGHKFVIEARNDTLWNAAKDQIRQKALPATFEVFKAVLGRLIKAAIG